MLEHVESAFFLSTGNVDCDFGVLDGVWEISYNYLHLFLWYTANRVKDRSSSRKSIMKKKRYRRGRSEKAAASEDKSAARKFDRQKSW